MDPSDTVIIRNLKFVVSIKRTLSYESKIMLLVSSCTAAQQKAAKPDRMRRK
jgi:hypothetical protein